MKPNPNAGQNDPKAAAALWAAWKSRDVKAARKAIRAGSGNPLDKHHQTVAAWALEDLKFLEGILEEGIDPNDGGSMSLLNMASARSNAQEVLPILFRFGADPNIVYSELPVIDAAHSAELPSGKRVLELLLKHGANPHLRGIEGETAVDRATWRQWTCRKQFPDLIEHIEVWNPIIDMLRGHPGARGEADIWAGTPPREREEVFCRIAGYGRLAWVEKFLKEGVRADFVSRSGSCGITPIYAAASGNHVEVVKLLLQAGADVNRPALGCRYTPLHGTAEGNRWQTARLLLEHGANPKLKDAYGRTPLQMAKGAGSKEVAAVLSRKMK